MISRTQLLKTLLSWSLLSPTGWLSAAQKPVEFDHFGTNDDRTFRRQVAPGQALQVRIKNTCPRHFTVTYLGISQGEEDRAFLGDTQCQAEEELTRTIVHDPQYGGYLVRITPSSSLSSICFAECKPAREITLVISIVETEWLYDLSGAFTVSQLTDPEFALRDSAGSRVVIRDREAESEVELGFAGLINLHHYRWPWVAASVGLGIDNGAEVNYFVGPSLRLGGKAYFTAGWNWGPVDRLPSGVILGRPISDDNLLNNLPTRTKGKFFLAASYGFLSPGEERLKRPLAPAGTE